MFGHPCSEGPSFALTWYKLALLKQNSEMIPPNEMTGLNSRARQSACHPRQAPYWKQKCSSTRFRIFCAGPTIKTPQCTPLGQIAGQIRSADPCSLVDDRTRQGPRAAHQCCNRKQDSDEGSRLARETHFFLPASKGRSRGGHRLQRLLHLSRPGDHGQSNHDDGAEDFHRLGARRRFAAAR
jgi:hypothetical protein